MQYVNGYLVDRVYGGPEEGGWWYDAGQPVLSLRLPDEDAHAFAEALHDAFKVLNDTSRSRYSMIGTPDYVVMVEDEEAKPFPEVAPHYE